MPAEDAHHVVPNIMLHPEPWQQHILEKRFEMARRVYNATRDEWLKRRRKYLQSPEFHAVKVQDIEDEGERRKAYYAAQTLYGFVKSGSNQKMSTDDRKVLFGNWDDDNPTDMVKHLCAALVETAGGMAIQAVRNFHDGHTGKPGIKYRDNPPPLTASKYISLDVDNATVSISGSKGWSKRLTVSVSRRALAHEKVQRSLGRLRDDPKCTIVRYLKNRSPRYELQVTSQGHAPLSAFTVVKDDLVGVDVGPSAVAVVSGEKAWLGPILDRGFIDRYAKQLRCILRHLDRQRRANNPEKFDGRGRYVGDGEPWTVSNRQLRTYGLTAETYRRLCEERKRQHYELAKKLLGFGNKFIVEDNSYKGWQAGLFGSQVGDFAPATFIDRLEEKARAAGGWVRRVSTWDTYLSSRCHCGRRESKDLGERTHRCECGVRAQRDLYSAFLARYVDEDGNLDESHAQDAWGQLEPAVRSASRVE